MVKLNARDGVVNSVVPSTYLFPIDFPPLKISEKSYGGILRLQGSASDQIVNAAVAKVCGIELPSVGVFVEGSECEIAWAGPKEWLLFVPAEKQDAFAASLRAALQGAFATVTLISDSRACFQISAPAAWEFIAKGCAVDCDPLVFAPGKVITTRFANQPAMIIHQRLGLYRIYVEASLVVSTVAWIADAAKEFSAA
ncbi:sarcosine oxidase subunit gamma [Pseudomonas sp. 2725]|jgi:sarcosine oxidase subunit gamma|uniref:sarcosine oxidase subunit gamma n=1 Tax=Pseudomonas sp. 2725 TaxID=3156449 RepID=UPI003D1D06DF